MFSASALLDDAANTVSEVYQEVVQIDLTRIWDGPARRAAEDELMRTAQQLHQSGTDLTEAAYYARLVEGSQS